MVWHWRCSNISLSPPLAVPLPLAFHFLRRPSFSLVVLFLRRCAVPPSPSCSTSSAEPSLNLLAEPNYCSTLEGEECYSCWQAYFELKDLEGWVRVSQYPDPPGPIDIPTTGDDKHTKRSKAMH
ncbi:hypothetical protein RIF29_38000 [Crotalaria pallida]|uniref:Uncharacterized protein n=1 Tax=Crotalaria pallida TaxID=3830 RepID=A0AAN9HL49_CROPI